MFYHKEIKAQIVAHGFIPGNLLLSPQTRRHEHGPSEPKGKEPLSSAADGRASDTENTFSEPFISGRPGRGHAVSRGCHRFRVPAAGRTHIQPHGVWAFPREACGSRTPALAAALSAEPAVSFLCSHQSNPLPDGSFPRVVLSSLELNAGPACSASHNLTCNRNSSVH